MWGQLGAQFNALLNPIVASVAGSLGGAIGILIVVFLTTWLVWQGIVLMTDGGGSSAPDVVRRAAIIIAVGTTATATSFITGPVLDAWDGVRGQIAAAFAAGSPIPVDPANPWSALDALSVQLNDALTTIRTRAATLGWTEMLEYLSYFAAFLLLMICGGLLQLIAGWLIMLSTFLGAFGIALAPLFILAAAFQISRQFFMNWVSFLLSAALLSSVAMFAIAVSLGLVNWLFARVNGAFGGLFGATADFFLIVGFIAVVHVMLAVMIYQGPAIAGQMLGAAGFGQGGGLAQTVLLLSRMGGARGGAGAPSAPIQVGTVAQPSAAYRAGQAAGQTGRFVYQRVAARMRRP
jgi:hypothetical protein